MEISPILMLRLFISSIVFGGFLGVILIVNYVVRFALGLEEGTKTVQKLYQHRIPLVGHPPRRRTMKKYQDKIRGAIVFFQDILVFVMAGIGIAVLNYTYNDGKNRIYTILGILIGVVIYMCVFGKISKWLLECIFYCINMFFSCLFYIIVFPFSKILKFFWFFLGQIRKKFLKALVKRKKKVYNVYVKEYYMQESVFGFINDVNKT